MRSPIVATRACSVVVYWVQDNITSTQIYYPSPRGPTVADITHAVNYAHSLGLKVALKPVRPHSRHTTAF